MSDGQPPTRIVDPRAVRVVATGRAAEVDGTPIVIEPAAVPLAPAARIAGAGVLGGVAQAAATLALASSEPDDLVLVDDVPVRAHLQPQDAVHAVLVEGGAADPTRTPVLLLPVETTSGSTAGAVRREVVVDGWRIEVEIESERRASLRERARRGREEGTHRGPTEVRAIIPGRVVTVSVVPGDEVAAGQQVLIVEAMKMQNELRAPRDGVVSRVAVGPAQTIEVGDLLLVLE